MNKPSSRRRYKALTAQERCEVVKMIKSTKMPLKVVADKLNLKYSMVRSIYNHYLKYGVLETF